MVSCPGPAARIVLMRGLGLTQVGFFPGPFGLGGGLNYSCFNFTGSNYASIAALSTNLIGGGGSWTISLLAKAKAFDGSKRAFFDMYGDTNNRAYVGVSATSQLILRYLSLQSDGGMSTGRGVSATVGAYKQYGMSFDYPSKLMKLWFGNSVIQTRVFASAGLASATQFILGGGGAIRFNSTIADVRLYNAAVTPNHSIPMTQEANGVAWYITPKADGSIVDSLGNGNTLTTTGGTLYGASGGPGLPWWPA